MNIMDPAQIIMLMQFFQHSPIAVGDGTTATALVEKGLLDGGLTDRGHAYCLAILGLPLPRAVWRIEYPDNSEVDA